MSKQTSVKGKEVTIWVKQLNEKKNEWASVSQNKDLSWDYQQGLSLGLNMTVLCDMEKRCAY